ncbi:26S proteasome complex subunit SEM1-like [Actinia tenebrosa]|uniref:26S proteasome complex subunit SEM1 n=1 Tax=Actinia tenebrosa TaxID=6105 RepID=A0A6P8H091_ACTTE|nr:26S proteasome complex subunit SEM1-like [Actinia tenebrosa]
MAAQQKKNEVGLFEEDDEFEEFPAEEWTEQDEDQEDIHVWEDNWDDDTVEDDFSNQLRAELEKQGHKVEQQQEPMKS